MALVPLDAAFEVGQAMEAFFVLMVVILTFLAAEVRRQRYIVDMVHDIEREMIATTSTK